MKLLTRIPYIWGKLWVLISSNFFCLILTIFRQLKQIKEKRYWGVIDCGSVIYCRREHARVQTHTRTYEPKCKGPKISHLFMSLIRDSHTLCVKVTPKKLLSYYVINQYFNDLIILICKRNNAFKLNFSIILIYLYNVLST